MRRAFWLTILALAGLLGAATPARAQSYIGFAYPAGAQQGTTAQIRLGGQRLDGVRDVLVTGSGVHARLVEYMRMLNTQETALMREQLRELQAAAKKDEEAFQRDKVAQNVAERIQSRLAALSNRPANRAIADLVLVEVTVEPDAEPGPREIRLVTGIGVTNPLVFQVGQFPEVARKPMVTADFIVLGNEAASQRKRPEEEIEERLTVPCVANGQVAAGEVNHYRFEARKGQRLVITVEARQLIPYLADAVPGWFQPVVALYDAGGKEVAYNDDYRFKPDPVILFEVPSNGEYLLTISDALFRGREDWVYRLTIAESPFVTSIFPLGGRAGEPAKIEMKGWNLDKARLTPPAKDAGPGVHFVAASRGALVSNRMPFVLDTLPEAVEKEPNNSPSEAQKVELPIILNGRIDHPDDVDVFQFEGRAGETIVAEVSARRLDSPLDSVLKITDAAGNLLALNDDYEDPGTGLNTHHADSYLMVELPSDGTYYVHLGDVARHGGEEYAYRLRLSAPRPDFALRVVPSGIGLRSNTTATVSVHAIRLDGFDGAIKLGLQDPPEGFSSTGATLAADSHMVRMTIRTTLEATEQPVELVVEGRAEIDDEEVVRAAVAAEDRMQAFLWRHLVPAEQFVASVYDPSYQPPRTRIPPPAPPKEETEPSSEPPRFTKAQVASRLRQIEFLYENWYLMDDFYHRKVAELDVPEE
jgi:hypothetical protein